MKSHLYNILMLAADIAVDEHMAGRLDKSVYIAISQAIRTMQRDEIVTPQAERTIEAMQADCPF